MKKTVLCVLMVTTMLAMTACGKKADNADPNSESSTEVTEDADVETDGAAGEADTAAAADGETMQVGNDKVGYAEVAADWLPFEDVNGATAFQYASPDNKVVLSMDVVDETNLSDEEKETMTAESAATGIWGTLDEGGVKQITGSKVTLDGYEAFQVYGAYVDEENGNASSIIVCWVFESDDEVIHVVSVEGAADAIMDAVTRVETTYKVAK